jgi:hypothetical protein
MKTCLIDLFSGIESYGNYRSRNIHSVKDVFSCSFFERKSYLCILNGRYYGGFEKANIANGITIIDEAFV